MPGHFDLLAPIYDRVIHSQPPEKLASLVGFPTDGWLLDAGGGTGRISQFFTGKVETVVIADLSISMLRQAKSKGGLLTVCSATELLPFPDSTFNRIIVVDAFHHLIDQRTAIRELWRVLERGGRMIIEEPDIRKIPVKLVAVAEKLLLMRSHFMPADRVAKIIPADRSRIRIERDGYTAWIVAEKSS
jgi:demethylmenaquinone methyltransferase/2-methoxy-6-polyprenyl-1,4-benzoquinol methylase